jgi:hypothetical protein
VEEESSSAMARTESMNVPVGTATPAVAAAQAFKKSRLTNFEIIRSIEELSLD